MNKNKIRLMKNKLLQPLIVWVKISIINFSSKFNHPIKLILDIVMLGGLLFYSRVISVRIKTTNLLPSLFDEIFLLV